MRSSHLVFALLALGGGVCCTLACSVLIGLDKFDKVDCGTCSPDAEAGVDDAADALPPPDAQLGDVESNPTVWASWPMPNPVYDAGLAADADPSGVHFADYDAAVPGSVFDGWTGLIWSLTTKDQVSQQGAADYCTNLMVLSQKWRLPSRIELVTLLDFTGSGVYVDPLFLVDGGAKASSYWTSSPDRTDINQYWAVDFGAGAVVTSSATNAKNVICVTGGKARK